MTCRHGRRPTYKKEKAQRITGSTGAGSGKAVATQGRLDAVATVCDWARSEQRR